MEIQAHSTLLRSIHAISAEGSNSGFIPTAWPSTVSTAASASQLAQSIASSSSVKIGARCACTSRLMRSVMSGNDLARKGRCAGARDLAVNLLNESVAHRRDGGDMIVRPHQHNGVWLAAGTPAQFIADIK